MDWLFGMALGLAAYLIGSIPSAYILVHLLKREDIRRFGSGNVGALNAYYRIGLWGAILVLATDAGKGALVFLVPVWLGAPGWTVFLTTFLVVAGHNWPIFLGFRGGKGAAAILGISLAVVPVLTLIVAGPTLLVALLLRNVVLGSAVGFVLLNLLLVVTRQSPDQLLLCLFLTLVVTTTYLVSAWGHIINSIKQRHWRELFTGLA